MPLFRIDSHKLFQGPHQGQTVEKNRPTSDAKAAVIMLHGRGATAQSMLMLADEFDQPDVGYWAPQAYNHTWYPYSFLAELEKNQPGLSGGLQVIYDLIEQLVDEGISRKKIIVLGFSQGACLAAEFAARHPQKPGGVMALSGGLIGPEVNPRNYTGDLDKTPVFLGCSDRDPHIPQKRVDETEHIFELLNADVTKKIYPNMGHTVNMDEIKYITNLLDNI